MIDISGLDKAELLAALVNGAKPIGLGVLQDNGEPMSIDEAQDVLAKMRSRGDRIRFYDRRLYFDYVKGRPIKCDISGDELDPRLYDRDQGEGAALRVVESLRLHACETGRTVDDEGDRTMTETNQEATKKKDPKAAHPAGDVLKELLEALKSGRVTAEVVDLGKAEDGCTCAACELRRSLEKALSNVEKNLGAVRKNGEMILTVSSDEDMVYAGVLAQFEDSEDWAVLHDAHRLYLDGDRADHVAAGVQLLDSKCIGPCVPKIRLTNVARVMRISKKGVEALKTAFADSSGPQPEA